jgi:YNFM family putative membrane transporter
MFSAMSGAAAFNILAALAPTWPILLIARALEDLILGGVPAVAMAYLAEEIHPDGLGFTMGLYVGGTAFGRHVRPGGRWMLAQLMTWRGALATLGALELVAALGFIFMLGLHR